MTINQNYVTINQFSTTPVGYSAECIVNRTRSIYAKNSNEITVKLNISSALGVNNTNNSEPFSKSFKCYENTLDGLSKIKVEVLDSQFRQIESSLNLSFIMNCITNDKKLKNIDINTRTNTISSIGLGDIN